MSLGSHLKKRRQELKKASREYSLRKVAGRIGVTPSFLSQLESGKASPPSERVLFALAKELRESPDVLLAMSGKVSSRFKEALMRNPEPFGELISMTERLPKDSLIRVVRVVKDGDW